MAVSRPSYFDILGGSFVNKNNQGAFHNAVDESGFDKTLRRAAAVLIRFPGDDCYKNGIYWNSVAAPVGTLSLFGIIIGPAIWIVLLVSAKLIRLFKMLLARRT